MEQVVAAIAAGRCGIAVSGALLRDAGVMLALKQREALGAMALSGPAQAPVTTIGEASLARAVNAAGGRLVLVDPDESDQSGLKALAKLLERAPFKPTITIVSQKFNPLSIRAVFGPLAVEHVKNRGKAFLEGLPVPPPVEAPAPGTEASPARIAPKAAEPTGPKLTFVGRDDELAALKDLLAAPGPIVVSGPRGVGRTTLVEQAITASGLTRLPDLTLGRGIGADALFARIASVARAGGGGELAELLPKGPSPVEAVAAAIRSLEAASGNAGQVLVIRELQGAMGRESDFFRKSRLELLLAALLTATFPLRVVFISTRQPVFFREGAATNLRRLTLDGIKGRFYFDIFQAYKAPEFPRDKFGPLSERLHGSPMAVRCLAIAVRSQEKGVALIDDEKFFRMEALDDAKSIERFYEKKVEKLAPPARAMVARLAHLRAPVDAKVLAELGLARKDRVQLLSDGLLDVLGTEDGEKRYHVHRFVRDALTLREITDFEVLGQLHGLFNRLAAAAEGVEKIAWQQEANRCATAANQLKSWTALEFPDHDGVLEGCYGLVRARPAGRPDARPPGRRRGGPEAAPVEAPSHDKALLAKPRLERIIRENPGNSDAYLLMAELLRKVEAKDEDILANLEAAMEKAPVPEIFHEAVAYYLARRQRPKAIAALERGVAALPTESRLKTRLASLLLREGRRAQAVDLLRLAMEQDPMLPDAYGLLGMARRDEGQDKIGEAEELLREAVRLAPNDTVQVTRLAGMLIDVARIDASRQAALRLEAKELLEARLKDDRESVEIPLLLAVLAREEGGNLERVEWLLKKIKKNDPKFKDSQHRVRLEFALLDLERGLLDAAEKTVRELVKKDPSNHRVFGALARILEARGMLIPAYSEYKRAVDRTGAGSLARVAYEREMSRLQALIEEAAASLGEGESLPLPEELPEESGLEPVAFEDSAEAEAGYNESVETAEAGPTEADGAAPSDDEG